MMITDYQNQAELLFKEYALAGPFLSCTTVVCGILACKMAELLFKEYALADPFLPCTAVICGILACKMDILPYQECNRLSGITDRQQDLIYQHSSSSSFILGVSTRYFLSDISMVFWFYPSLGGMEYVLHHLLSMSALLYTMLTGLGQVTYMVLLSEATTPGINLRWYLDVAGLKRSKAYVVNGVVIFFTWLVARIILFLCIFYHVYLHFDQVLLLPSVGLFLALIGPVVLASLNVVWQDLEGHVEDISKEALKIGQMCFPSAV